MVVSATVSSVLHPGFASHLFWARWFGLKLGELGTPNGSEFVTIDDVPVELKTGTGARGFVHLSLSPLPHVYSTLVVLPLVATMTQNEKSAFPSLLVSKSAHPSRVLLPDVAVSSQPHFTLMLVAPGRP